MPKSLFLVLILINCVFPQDTLLNKYGLNVISNPESFLEIVQKDSSKMLVDLELFIPGIVMDIRYATENNFYGSPVYPKQKAFLRKPAAEALLGIQTELLKQKKALKIFDAYRPYSVTLLFYEKIKDTNFVASAWTGSRHNRGCAVDLTIVDLVTGKEIKMPTGYDEFVEKASIDYQQITPEEKHNRTLLLNIMKKYGFIPYKSEWWHYDFSGWQKYEITDINFNILENMYFNIKR